MNSTGGIPSRDKLIGGVVVSVLAVVGVVVNTATLWAIGRSRKLRQQPATVLMLSLTTADLIECAVVFPFTAQNFLNCWFCTDDNAVCTIYGFLFYWNSGAILLLQAGLAINRWTTVCCHPRWHFNIRTSLMCAVVCWVLPSLLLLIPTLNLYGELNFDQLSGTCTLSIDFRYVIFPTTLGISALVICAGYLLILKKVRKTRKIYQNKIASSLRHITTKNKDILQLSLEQHLKGSEKLKLSQNLRKNSSNKDRSIHNDRNQKLDKSNNVVYSTSSETHPSEETRATSPGNMNTEDSVAILERQQSEKIQRRIKEEIGMTITVAVIFFSFILLYMPGALVLLVDPTTEVCPRAHIPTYIIMWMTGLVNPLVYVTCNQSYRDAFADLFSTISKRIL